MKLRMIVVIFAASILYATRIYAIELENEMLNAISSINISSKTPIWVWSLWELYFGPTVG